ncbi:hypothetical protein LXH13_25360 [Streptomyces spinosirectus]|uniref:DUF6879 family protein n=1 Tax=Streptomyces TaxID=1883 RepID=UPI000D4868E6|nr:MULTISPECIES: DUF6879 family protein [Streptomyces]PTM91164.1 hypothetical protein C7821_111139 [Streptomyces sp. VMFN-G11Ma]UIR20156.1 hypothetical protein LXH13_25360 [Streptomyces spinosirectus]
MSTVPTFEELFRDCRESAVHLEMRDSYMKSDPSYVDWAAGIAIDPAERWADWLTLVTDATSRGVKVRRARIVSEPVSQYIRFEYEVTNGLNIAAGEEVRWLPRRRTTGIALPGNDFWLFDSSLLLVNHFDGDGEWLDPVLSTNPQEIKLCDDAFESVWQLGIPHDDYELA